MNIQATVKKPSREPYFVEREDSRLRLLWPETNTVKTCASTLDLEVEGFCQVWRRFIAYNGLVDEAIYLGDGMSGELIAQTCEALVELDGSSRYYILEEGGRKWGLVPVATFLWIEALLNLYAVPNHRLCCGGIETGFPEDPFDFSKRMLRTLRRWQTSKLYARKADLRMPDCLLVSLFETGSWASFRLKYAWIDHDALVLAFASIRSKLGDRPYELLKLVMKKTGKRMTAERKETFIASCKRLGIDYTASLPERNLATDAGNIALRQCVDVLGVVMVVENPNPHVTSIDAEDIPKNGFGITRHRAKRPTDGKTSGDCERLRMSGRAASVPLWAVRISCKVFNLSYPYILSSRNYEVDKGWDTRYTNTSLESDDLWLCFKAVADDRVVRIFATRADANRFLNTRIPLKDKPEPVAYIVHGKWLNTINHCLAGAVEASVLGKGDRLTD